MKEYRLKVEIAQLALAVPEGGGPQLPGRTAGGVGRWRIGPILFYPIGLLLSIVQ